LAVISATACAFACGGSGKKKDSNDGSGGEGASSGSGGSSIGGAGAGQGASSGSGGSSDAGTGATGEAGAFPAGSGGTLAGEGGTAGAAGEGGAAGEAPVTSVTLSVDTARDARPISPLIYGVNPRGGLVSCSDARARFTLCRAGDQAWSTYNWENNAANTGADNTAADPRCSENSALLSSSDVPGDAVLSRLAQADAAGATSMVTLPLLDYVAADKVSGSGPPECSGDVTKTPNYLATRFKQNRARKGAPLATVPDLDDAYVNQDEFVAFLEQQHAPKPLIFALDNQPELWDLAHKPLFPDSPVYDDVVSRNVEYARMLREVWPEASISGWVGYGFAAFISLQNSGEIDEKGEFIDYYLGEMQAASEDAGKRLLDYFDVHWYSEQYAGDARVINADNSPELVAARVQAPRSLFDGDFRENSWIVGFLGNQPIRFLPWLRERIAAHYPGTKLALSAWAYGGGDHISGAIAAADALGIFGRQGVELAAVDTLWIDASYIIGAFQMFRNFDGAGQAFGDTSVHAESSDLDVASVYASVDQADPDRVVIIAINRAAWQVEASIELSAPSSYSSADVYRLIQGSAEPAQVGGLEAVGTNAFGYVMPPYSVSVLVPVE
jgi:hypothetical protein